MIIFIDIVYNWYTYNKILILILLLLDSYYDVMIIIAAFKWHVHEQRWLSPKNHCYRKINLKVYESSLNPAGKLSKLSHYTLYIGYMWKFYEVNFFIMKFLWVLSTSY